MNVLLEHFIDQPVQCSTRREPSSTWTTTSRLTCPSCKRTGLPTASSPGRYATPIFTTARAPADVVKVIQFGDDSPYAVQATLEWGTLDEFKKAAGSDATKKVMDDVKNFSNTSPKLFSGEVVGSQ